MVGTSGLSNNATNSIDLFTMVFNLTSNLEVLTTERLVLKLYSIGTSTNNSNVTAYFEGGEYSFLTTTLSTVRLGNTNTLRKKGHLFYFLSKYFKRKLSIYSHKVFYFFDLSYFQTFMIG